MATEEERIGSEYARSRHMQAADLPGAQVAPTPKPEKKSARAPKDPIKQALAAYNAAIAAERKGHDRWIRREIREDEYNLLKAQVAHKKALYLNQCDIAAKNAPAPVVKEVESPEERLGKAHATLVAADTNLADAMRRLDAHRNERSVTNDEFRLGDLDGAINGLTDIIVPRLKRVVDKAHETVRNVEVRMPKAPKPMTELQKKEAAWRARDKTSYR